MGSWYMKWAAIVICAIVGYGAYELVCWRSLGAAEWAAWVGAVGTVAAFAGTIWIATREAAERRRKELTQATIVAAGMVFGLTMTQKKLGDLVQRLRYAESHGAGASDFAFFKMKFEEQTTWDSSQILLLAPLPNACAFKVAGGLDRIRTCIDMIKRYESSIPHSNRKDGGTKAGQIAGVAEEAINLFGLAANECQKAAHRLTSPYS